VTGSNTVNAEAGGGDRGGGECNKGGAGSAGGWGVVVVVVVTEGGGSATRCSSRAMLGSRDTNCAATESSTAIEKPADTEELRFEVRVTGSNKVKTEAGGGDRGEGGSATRCSSRAMLGSRDTNCAATDGSTAFQTKRTELYRLT
jgi:hypothetical protein